MEIPRSFIAAALHDDDKQVDAALPASFIKSVLPEDAAPTTGGPALRESLYEALPTNPDQFAKAKQLSRDVGLPPDMVDRNYDKLERQQRLDSIAGQVAGPESDTPVLADHLSEPSFAKVTHDDIDALAMLERGMRAVPAALFRSSAGVYGLGEAAGSFISRVATRPLAKAGIVPDFGGAVAESFRDIRKNQEVMVEWAAGDRSGAGLVENAVYSGIESIAQNAPGLIAAVMTGNPALALGPMVASVGGQSITDSLDKGVPIERALVRGASDTVVEYVMEKIPLVSLLKNIKTETFLKTLAVNMGQEIVTEEATTVLQNLNEWATNNPDQPFSTYLEALPEAMASTLISTIVASGGQTSIVAGVDQIARKMDGRKQQADAAKQHFEALQHINQIAANAALRARDPESFRAYVTDLAGDGLDVYVDGSVFLQAIDAGGEKMNAVLEAMPTVAAQLNEEGPTNGLVRIPAEEFLAAASGTGLDEALLPHLRAAPHTPSMAEAEEFYQAEAEETKKEAARIMEVEAENTAFTESAIEVESTIFDDLNAAGRFTSDINRTYASLARDFFVVQAARMNTTPGELYAQHPLTTVSTPLGAAFDQLDYFKEPDFYEIETDSSGVQRIKKSVSSSEDILFATDPTESELKELLEEARSLNPAVGPKLRVLRDLTVNKVHMWPAIAALHGDFMVATGIESHEVEHGEVDDDGNIIWTYSSADPEGKPRVAQEKLSRYVLADAVLKQLRTNTDPDILRQEAGDSFYSAALRAVTAASQTKATPEQWGVKVGKAEFNTIGILEPVHALPITPEMRDSVLQGQPLFQEARGSFNPKTDTIALLNKANLTTFLHELGHFQLEVMADLAARPNAPAEIVDDMNKILTWFGVSDLATWSGMALEQQRPYHEKFAKGFELYLRDGKAPSIELQPVFQRIAAWMRRAYQSLQDFAGIELSDEVRGVFDRMLASERAITEAEQAQAMEPLFQSREEFAGTDEDWAEYLAGAEAAHNEAVEQLQSRSIRDMRWVKGYTLRTLKKLKADAKEKRAAVQQEVQTDLERERVYAVQAFIRTGTLPEGVLQGLSQAQRRILTQSGLSRTKLDLDDLKAFYGEGEAAIWRYLPAGANGLVANEGADPANIARLFGYEDGTDEMVREILATEPLAAAIEGETDNRMLERYGDLSSPEAIEQAVNEAIHNEVRTRHVATELKALEKGVGTTADMMKALKSLVRQTLGAKTIRSIRPAQNVAAETRAAREAQAARKKGEIKTAITAMRQRLWHNLMGREATGALTEVERGLKYVRKFNKRNKAIKLAYQERIEDLLDQYDMRKSTTLKEIKRREFGLSQWLDQVEEETGVRPVVDDKFTAPADKIHYTQMTLDDFRALMDAIKSIEHVGREVQKLLTDSAKRDLNTAATALQTSADANAPRTVEVRLEHSRRRDKLKDWLDVALAIHRKADWLWRELDGNKDDGVAYNLFSRSMNKAGANEATRMRKSGEALTKIFKPLMKRYSHRQLYEPALVPGAVGVDGKPLYLSQQARIMVAAYMGNPVNHQRMRDGNNWTDQTMQAIVDSLAKADMDMVQALWDHLQTYKPELGQLDRDTRGVEPKWVDAVPLATKHGTYAGGYMPIMFDSKRSVRAQAFDSIVDLSAMMHGARGRQTTQHGFMKERSKGDVKIPVRLDFGVVFSHVNAVNHRLAWERWVIDTRRLMGHASVKSAITEHLGVASYNTINGLITDIALGRSPHTMEGLDKTFEWLNNNASIAVMAWNLKTAVIQPLGVTQSITRLGGAEGGYKWMAQGLREFYGGAGWRANLAEIHSKSEFMRNRALTMDQNLRRLRNQLELPGYAVTIKDTFFMPMVAMQTTVDAPTWAGAYNKALAPKADGGLELSGAAAIDFADQVVKDAQGSGNIADLASAQRGPPIVGILTRFYNYMNTTANIDIEIVRRKKHGVRDYATAAHDLFMTNIIPGVMMVILKNLLFGDEGDDESFLEQLGAELGSSLVGLFILLREISGAFRGYQYEGPASFKLVKTIGALGSHTLDLDFDATFWKSLIDTAGYALGLPTPAIRRTIEGAAALIEGDTKRPTAVLFGPPR